MNNDNNIILTYIGTRKLNSLIEYNHDYKNND